jgi:type IV pilus assembly protein PilV
MPLSHKNIRIAPARARGFSMLEVLITLVIIALSLLGTAGMQTYAIKMSQGGQLRTQAVILGMDILERIEANNDGAVAGSYVATTLPSSFTTDCYSAPCTAASLATYDLYQFQAKLGTQLPSASATVSVTGTGPWVYTVQINWVERITRGSTTAVTGSGSTNLSNAGQTENFSYTVSRKIYNRSLVV